MSSSNFVDHIKIFCRSGKGGPGSMHFYRAKGIPKGGPDGGDGGAGGNIVLKGNKQLWTLLHLRYMRHIFAEHGEAGGGNRRHGKDGEHQIIEVPLGTSVKDPETNQFIGEITEHDEEIVLFQGGRGGLGNDHFKSPTNQAPQYAQPGETSQEGYATLELKVLADVGLVGFPNAGKSTLLSVVSAAKPKIANYPFTTLVPNLGIVSYYDHQSFVMADIPGIIEGAAEGKGLGTRFLRHIERNSVLLFLIPADSDDHYKEFRTLLHELEKHNVELLDKERILAISKADLLDEELEDEIAATFPPTAKPIFFSSVANSRLKELKEVVWEAINREED